MVTDASDNVPEERPSHGGQMLGSLAAALLIVVGVIYAVTARLGPTSIAELRAQEELDEERQEAAEETREADEESDRSDRRRGRGSDRRGNEDRRGRD